jgi:hypothetical protein
MAVAIVSRMFDPRVRDGACAALGPGAVAVVRSLPERAAQRRRALPFRRTDLSYLTGFLEPDTTLCCGPGAETERS